MTTTMYINSTQITNFIEFTINKIEGAIDTATILVTNIHTIDSVGDLETWHGYNSADTLTILEDATIIFKGFIYDVKGDNPLTLLCQSKDGRLDHYTIAKGNTTFNLLEAKVKSVSGSNLYLKDENGDDLVFTADQYNKKYVIVSDSTLSQISYSLVNGGNDYLGTDSYLSAGASDGLTDYTDVENTNTGTGDNWEVEFDGDLYSAKGKVFLKIDISYLNIPISATLSKWM